MADVDVQQEPTNPVFQWGPATDNSVILDMNSKKDTTIFRDNVKPLSKEFDLSSDGLSGFLTRLRDRATVAGWEQTLQVEQNSIKLPFLDNYGLLTMQECQDQDRIYIEKRGRDAQNSYQISICLKDSLTDEAKTKVEARPDEFTFDGRVGGISYLKSIIMNSIIDTRYTTTNLKKQLENLPNLMVGLDHNVDEFNTQVKLLLHKLSARGAIIHESDQLIQIFAGYQSCADPIFKSYMRRNYDDYLDNVRDFSVNQIMTHAENKYKALFETGEWMEPTSDQRKIVALTAESQRKIVALTAEIQTMKQQTVKGRFNSKKNTPNAKGSGIDRKNNYPEWKTTQPAEGSPISKQVKGRAYHWCPKHKLWAAHKPEDCRLFTGPSEKPKATTDEQKHAAGGLKVSRALMAWAEDAEADGYTE